MVESRPTDWLTFLGLPRGESVSAVDADVSSVTAAADKVLLVSGPQPYLVHLEFQSSDAGDLDRRMLLYNVLLRSRHGVPVRSVALLLHPRAVSPRLEGGVRDFSAADSRLDFAYRLVRLWEQPPESCLNAGLGTLALTSLTLPSSPEPDRLVWVYQQIAERLRRELTEQQAREIWAATYLMSGLRYDSAYVQHLMKGVWDVDWENSTTYQTVLERGVEKGRVEEARAAVLLVGRKRFGPPDTESLSRLNELTTPEQLEGLLERAITASSWRELLNSLIP